MLLKQTMMPSILKITQLVKLVKELKVDENSASNTTPQEVLLVLLVKPKQSGQNALFTDNFNVLTYQHHFLLWIHEKPVALRCVPQATIKK